MLYVVYAFEPWWIIENPKYIQSHSIQTVHKTNLKAEINMRANALVWAWFKPRAFHCTWITPSLSPLTNFKKFTLQSNKSKMPKKIMFFFKIA